MTLPPTILGFDVVELNNLLMIGLFSFIGFGAHMVKKFLAEDLHPIEYLRCYAARTVSSWLTITGASVTSYMATGDLHAITYITMAYMADSLVNKAPTQEEVDDYRKAVEAKKLAKQGKIPVVPTLQQNADPKVQAEYEAVVNTATPPEQLP